MWRLERSYRWRETLNEPRLIVASLQPKMSRFLMTMVLHVAGVAALHVAPTRIVVKPAVARRAAILVMDEEHEVYIVPFAANVTSAAADIKEVLTFEALTKEAEQIYEVLLLGYDAEKVKRLNEVEAMLAEAATEAMAPAPQAALPQLTPELAALTAEKQELDEALLLGYDAEKVQRLAEVEAALEAGGAAPEAAALSAEEAARAAWLAGSRGGQSDTY